MFECPPGCDSLAQSRLPQDDGSRLLNETIVVKVVDMLNISRSVSSQLEPLVESGRKVAPEEGDETPEKQYKSTALPVYKYVVEDLGGAQRFLVLLDTLDRDLPQPGAILKLKNAPLQHGVLLCGKSNIDVVVLGTRPTRDQLRARLDLELASSGSR